MKVMRTSVVQQVVEYIRKNIEDGIWPVGEKIPSENVLSRTLGVSRPSIRVAIQQFVGVGVLQTLHGKGTFVKSNSLDAFVSNTSGITSHDYRDIKKVLEFRRILETEGCRLAAENATPEMVKDLEVYLKNMIENVGNAEVFVKEDMRFHQRIAEASGNQLLEKSLREVFKETHRTHIMLNAVFGYKDGVYYHSAILNAIQKKDAKLASKMMHEHLQQALECLE